MKSDSLQPQKGASPAVVRRLTDYHYTLLSMTPSKVRDEINQVACLVWQN